MVPIPASSRAAALLRDAVVIDAVFPFEPEMGNDASILPRWLDAGFTFISLHPAGDRHTAGTAVRRIARARRAIREHPRLRLVESVDDITAAEGTLGVGLHLEGSNLLENDLDMVEVYYALGVRFIHPVFNLNNAFGGGCADRDDAGLTRFGERAVVEMNRVGMLLDGAHVGRRTTMEMMERSTAPVIFSHNGCAAVHPHFRNVRDDQIDACARGGGVIGISGANNYLGGGPTEETLFRHIDHVVQRAGASHVGLGFDYVHDTAGLDAYVRARPDEWAGEWRPWAFAQPEQLPALVEYLLARGYDDDAVRGVLGANFLRVFRESWKPVAGQRAEPVAK